MLYFFWPARALGDLPKRWRLLSLIFRYGKPRGACLSPLGKRGGDEVYITLAELVAVLSLLILLAQYMDNHKKR